MRLNNLISRQSAILSSFLLVALLLLSSCCQRMCPSMGGSSSAVHPAITSSSQCGTCGMYPARYPKWHSQVLLDSGQTVAFCGMKCLFRYRFALTAAAEKNAPRITSIKVKDYSDGTWMTAEAATYVVGSSIHGPMGPELIPFASATAATTFQPANGGNLAAYSEITEQTVQSLMGGHGQMMRH
jgi:copper chaperone NosL